MINRKALISECIGYFESSFNIFIVLKKGYGYVHTYGHIHYEYMYTWTLIYMCVYDENYGTP